MAESKESEKKGVESAEKTEEDLDSLLNSALDDFTELSKEKPKEKTTEPKPEANASLADEDVGQMWSDMFKRALEQTDPNIQEMFQQGNFEQSAFAQDFTKMAEAAAKAIEGNDSSTNFADIMADTLRNLNENSEALQNQFGNPEEMANLFQELGLNGEGPGSEGNLEDIPPFMQSIMQTFLCKEVLYPSMKDFVEKYPIWLEENKATLAQEQFDNYSKQLELMKKVVAEFEAESESDNDEVKKQRFQRIIGYMQQMQALGHPPADIIGGDLSDESALPNLPPGMDPNQCSLM